MFESGRYAPVCAVANNHLLPCLPRRAAFLLTAQLQTLRLPPLLDDSPSTLRVQALASHGPSSSAFASAASLTALERQFNNLEHRLDTRFSELLNTLSAAQPLHLAQPNLPALLPQQQALPLAHPAAASAIPSAGQQPTLGESSPLLVTCCFTWVSPNIVSQVEHNQLKLEHLVKLHDPESRVSKELT
ncbi:hypothetical protein [Sporisorium scitamineum]|uniref:Uncharacterized protein n=1 Tax=Sporisorium scitamineum TaxID=49012 RepID=A0A0F7S2H0_9BASI|nr:hypothetical protein [Sporisorium scitamineum]